MEYLTHPMLARMLAIVYILIDDILLTRPPGISKADFRFVITAM